ncbi:hypothetical protein ACQ4M4_14060 [Leptolyngbya sp. AN02str]|uniref:hypothetical protein n=1 Tax=Leptolyngbya sp. AN02str TaxID=3423363 RepID=UPI003D3147B1
MKYSIPTNPQDIVALRQQPVDENLMAAVLAGVVGMARSRGQSLEDLTAEVLAEDGLLDAATRRQLSEVVAQAWKTLP